MIQELTISGLKNIKHEKMALKPVNFVDGAEFDWKIERIAGHFIGE